MGNSRTTNSVLTMAASGLRQVLTLVFTFLSRTVFIKTLGAEYLGLNGLFSNVLSILALSELGIGSAISFYLYSPIANRDYDRIKSLMQFYKKSYRAVGVSIVVLGTILMPFLPYLVNFNQDVPVNLYLVYFLYLLNTASSYLFFAYKQAIVTANQEQYKIEKINIAFTFINCTVDVLILLLFKNYIIYLIVKFLLVLVKNIIIAIRIDKEYPFVSEKDYKPLEKTEIKNFFKDIGSVSLFRLGSTLFNATDNIIISMILGTIVVGYYSNYYMIISQINMIIGIIIKSFVAGIGNVMTTEEKNRQYEIYKELDFFVFGIAIICTTCLFQLLNSFVNLWIGKNYPSYVLSQSVVLLLCISFYLDTTMQIPNSFREGSGNFKTGRSLQLLGGIANIFLSIILGKKFGLVGIFAATIIGKGVITVIPFIIGVSRDVFGFSGFKLLSRYFFNLSVMVLSLALTWFLGLKFHMTSFGGFILECGISITVPFVLILMVYRKLPEMQTLLRKIKSLKAFKIR